MSSIKLPTLVPTPQSLSIEDQSVVRQWSENIQRTHGDCISSSEAIKVKKICFPENQLDALKMAWESLTSARKERFINKYGQIAQLLYVQVNIDVLKALIQHWDPTYRCFTFKSIDMTPTIEEYQSLLRTPAQERVKAYSYIGSLTMKRALSAFLVKIRTSDIEKHMRMKGRSKCLPMEYILSLQQRFADEDKGLSLLALGIFSTILFPKVKEHVEERVVKLFLKVEEGVDLVVPILAETFRSLNHCRTERAENFIGCAPLLYIWIISHVKYPSEFKCPQIKFSKSWNKLQNPILEFVQSGWSSTFPEEEVWKAFFGGLKIEDVVWKAPWMSIRPMMYKCGEFQNLPLLGPWGCITYAPLLVLRQMWIRQFIPATHELINSEFAYDKEFCESKIQEIVKAWKRISKIQSGQFHDDTTEEYKTWHSNKTKIMSASLSASIKIQPKEEIVIPNQSTECELREEELKRMNSSLVQENERLKVEMNQCLLRNTTLEKELQELKGNIEKQRNLERELSALDTEARDLNRNIHRLRRDKEATQATLKSQDDQISQLQSNISLLHELVGELEKGIDIRNKEILDLEERNKILHQTIDVKEGQICEVNRENTTLRETSQSLSIQLTKHRDAAERLMKDYMQLKEHYDRLRDDYEFLRLDNTTLRNKSEHMLIEIRKVTKKADDLAEEARIITKVIAPTQPNGKDMLKFLGKLRTRLEYWGRFY